MKKILILGILFFIFLAVVSDNKSDTADSGGKDYKEVKSRLSSTVSFTYSESRIAKWLQSPNLAFVETYVYFEDDLNESTIFGLDMELLEGMKNPIRFEGADWMALVGLQRNGTVWVAAGTDKTRSGKPSSDRDWQFKQLGSELKSNTWYRLKTIANFDTLEFVSFTVTGPDINITIDLSGIQLDYPNKMPFDGRALTHYVWTIDGTSIGGSKDKSSSAYFDDISYGIIDSNGAEVVLHTDNIESTGTEFPELNIQFDKIDVGQVMLLSAFDEKKWYQERDEALTRPITKPFARSGNKVIEADAEVRKISREEWMDQ